VTTVSPATIDRAAALAELRLLAAAAEDPALTDADLDLCLTRIATTDAAGNDPDRYVGWAGGTAVLLGATVAPRNGHRYEATVAGTTGTSAPTWPTALNATVNDGGVTWKNVGTTSWTPTYLLRLLPKAIGTAFRVKAAKLTPGESFSGDGVSFDPDVRRQSLLAMAQEWERKVVGTVGYQGRQGENRLIDVLVN